MKRLLMIVVGSIILLSLLSSSLGEGSLPGQWYGSTIREMTETPDGFYMLADGFLYYYDPDTFEPELACSRLNCLHQFENNPGDCDACTLGDCLTMIDGHVYYDEINTFGRMLPDGTNHEEWMKAPWSMDAQQIPYGFQGQYYIYIEESTKASEDLDISIDCTFCVIDISDPKNECMIIEKWNGLEQALMPIQVSDGKLYYLTGTLEGEKHLWVCNLTTNEKKELYHTKNTGTYYCENNIAYMLKYDQGVSAIDLGTAEERTILLKDEADPRYTQYYCDGRYFYSIGTADDGSSCGIMIYDLAGNELVSAQIQSASTLYYIANEYLIFRGNDGYDLPRIAVELESLLRGEPDIKDFIIPEVLPND